MNFILKTLIALSTVVALGGDGLFGQGSISGTIVSDLGDTIAFAQVTLYLKDGKTVFKEGQSSSDGYYAFKRVYLSDTLIFRVDQLGYNTFKKSILASQAKDIIFNPVITSGYNDLPTAVVLEKRIGFTIRGDTISFNPTAYLVGNERTLGDLIKNIPELELTANGEVKYKGAKVTGVLVDGFDVFNGQQKILTEDFGVSHILSIDIIENYRGVGDFLAGETNKVALDIKLKNESKGKWLGRYEGGVTPKGQWRATGSTTKAERQRAFSFKASANSVGEAALSSQDYLNTKSALSDVQENLPTQFTLEDLLPDGILPPAGLERNKEGMINVGYDEQKYKKLRLKSSLIGILANRDVGRFAERRALNEVNEGLIQGKEANEIDMGLLLFNFRMEEKVAKKDSSAKTAFAIDFYKENSNNSLEQYSDIDTIGFQRRINRNDISAQFNWRGSSSHKITSKADFLFLRNSLVGVNNVTSSNPLLFAEAQPAVSNIHQQVGQVHLKYEVSFKNQFLNKRWHVFLNSTVFSGELGKINSSESINALNDAKKGNEQGVRLDGRVKWTEGQFSVTITNAISSFRRSSLGEVQRLNIYDCSLFLKMQFSQMHFGLLQFTGGEQPSVDLLSSVGTTEFRDIRSFNVNDGLPFILQKSKGVAFSYFNRNLVIPRLTFLSTINVSNQKNGQFQIAIPDGDFFKYKYILTDDVFFQSVINKILIPFHKFIFLDVNSSYTRIRQQSLQFDVGGLDLKSLKGSASLRISKIGDFEFSSIFSWLISSQKIDNLEVGFKERTMSFSSKFTGSRFRASLEFGRRFSRNMLSSTLTNNLLDANVFYPLGAGKWEVFIKGRNLLQLSPSARGGNVVRSNEVENFIFNDFPGYFLIGLERLL